MYNKELLIRDSDVVNDVLKYADTTRETEDKISCALDVCNNVVVCGKSEFLRAAAALRYALGDKCSCKRIVYVRYTRTRFVLKNISVDTVLKYDLCNIKAPDSILRLCEVEKLLDEDTILIIDNYDIGSPSPYMRHLFGLHCKVVVLSPCNMESAGKNAVKIDMEQNDNSNAPDFSVLASRESELLMTLCAILKYLDSSVRIISSKTGVFDRESVRFYLGELCEELDVLEDKGFVRIAENGRIYVDADIMEKAVSVLKPSAENCKTFMDFADRICNFVIDQESKDITASLRAVGEYNSFAASEEFLTAYTHFSMIDSGKGIKLYNCMMAYVLENCAMQKGSDYIRHICMRNKGYFLHTLKSCLEDKQLLSRIYANSDYLPAEYTGSIRAQLDIIRLTTCFVRNLTPDMYAENEDVFLMLYEAMEDVMKYSEKSLCDSDVMMLLLDDVIRLCDESFGYFEVIDEDGNYHIRRENPCVHRVSYVCERRCDSSDACSIEFGHSLVTVKLYGMYQKYLDKWLELSHSTDMCFPNSILKQLFDEKLTERIHRREMISTHYIRIISGFDKYFDFLSEKHRKCNVYECDFDSNAVKRLDDNRHLFLRGFDKGTKIGAERYSNMIIETVSDCDDCFRVVLPVLCFDYPVNDAVYGFLGEKGLSDILCKDTFNNRTKQMLIETLVSDYQISPHKTKLVKLYEELILKLWENVTHNTAFSKRLVSCVRSLYVRVKLCELCDKQEIEKLDKNDFSTMLFEKIMNDENKGLKYCDDLISDAVYELIHTGTIAFSKSKICKALEVCVYENVLAKDVYTVKGAIALAEYICDEETVCKLKDIVSNTN